MTVRASPENLIWLGMAGHWAFDTTHKCEKRGLGSMEEADTALITLE